jgi:aldehyde:ferredoxin oxidoreductase
MKLIRVNLSDKSIKYENVPQSYAGLGGRGLTSVLVNAEVPPACNPLGPENKLVFAPGLLSGTSLVNTSRLSVGAKSPLTGTIKESNAGGTVGQALGRLGVTAIVVEGRSADGQLQLLRIDEKGGADLLPAGEFKGMRTYALTESLIKTYGKNTSVMCIGPAGEAMMKSASIQSSDMDNRPCRAAGRGGLGAVMGSKGLKALIVDRTGKSPDAIADPEAFRGAARVFAKAVRENGFSGKLLPAYGTATLVAALNSMSAFPSYNATKGVLEGWEKISGETLAKTMKERGGGPGHIGCAQCIIRCSNIYNDREGGYLSSSVEYETIWAFGGMTGITDLDAIARMDFLCDDLGLDTMNTGVALAVAMDAGYRPFGDAKAAIGMLEEIALGTDMGRLLGDGPAAVGARFNHRRVPAVKGQSIAAYDPRGIQGNGVTYATSPMGADHTAGNLIGQYMAGHFSADKTEGLAKASRSAQVQMAVMDSLGLCIFAAFAIGSPEGGKAFFQLLSAKTGTGFGPESLEQMGMRILQAEREFNRNAGFTSKDDRLPEFFYKEPLPPRNTLFTVTDKELDAVFPF